MDCVLRDKASGDVYYETFHNQLQEMAQIDIPKSLDSVMQILDLIEPEVYHWTEFRFHFDTYNHTQSLLSRLHKLPGAPLLKEFRMYHTDDVDYEFLDGDHKTSHFPFHGNAPSLECAIFWSVHIDWDKSLPFLQGLRQFELFYHAKSVLHHFHTNNQKFT